MLSQSAEIHPVSRELDRAFLAELRGLVELATADFERFEFARVLQETESFFWSRFTDTYLELAKARARSDEDAAGRGSAVATLRLALSVLLRLFAPFLPYVSEELWSWCFAEESGRPSIHRAAWPGAADFQAAPAPEDAASFGRAVAALAAVNKAKADASVSIAREIEQLVLRGHPETLQALAPVLADVLAATRCQSHRLEPDPSLEKDGLEVGQAVFAERPAKAAG